MAINLNTNPYYDDFDDSKNYLKILFKPGYAVQARELTQLQTALQKQITRFGNHVFKDGSIVLNGNTTHTQCRWITVEAAVGTTVDGSLAVGLTLIGQTTGAIAKIITYENISTTQTRLYFVYASGVEFQQAETVATDDLLTSFDIIDNASTYTGAGTVFSIDDSIFFVNGYFAFCSKQTIVLDSAGYSFDKRVGIKVTESIVSSSTDETLLDPAQGSYNFAAPGADRISISLDLVSFTFDPLVASLPTIEDFIELARFDDGALIYKITGATYSELENTLARRTYDESGDYAVKAFSAKVIPHIRGEAGKYSIAIGPGKAYVKGYEFETIATSFVDIDRALDTDTKTNYSVDTSFGDYFVINAPINSAIDYTLNPSVDLVSNGVTVGTANVRSIEFVQTDRYRLYVFNVRVTSTTAIRDITAITSGTWFASIDSTYYTSGTAIVKSPNRVPLIRLPNTFVETLQPEGSSATEFEAQIRFPESGNITLITETFDGTTYATATLTAPSGTTILSSYADEFIAVNQSTGAVVPVLSTYGSIGASAKLLFAQSYVGTNVRIYAVVSYINKAQKSKVLQTLTLAAQPISANRISLGYADCYKLVSVTAINSGDPTVNVQDVTSLFDFNNGQTDEIYDHGSIILKPGQTLPRSFDKIVVEFQYFSHPAPTNGYFSRDSYPSEIAYEDIPTYTSSTGEVYRLTDCLDFRPRRADNSTELVGYHTAFPRTRISFDYSYYLPRIDKLVLTKERKLTVLKGVSAEQPTQPADLYDAMTLYVFKLPAYTTTPQDVSLTYIDNRRYTMRDIGKIDKRVERIEYYTSLSFLEKQAKDETLYDNMGVERFKNGILVDAFTGHSVGDASNPNYLCSINKEARTLRPRFSSYSFNYTPVTIGTTAQQRGDLITLPVASTEVATAQPYATGTVNLNPFQVFKWDGTLKINPATDNWIDTQTKPDVNVNLNGENDVYTTLVPNVNNPAVSGVVWNDWQTVVKGVDVQQNLSNQLSQSTAIVDGKVIGTSTSSISSSIATTTDTSSFRTGLQLSSSAVSTVQRDLGTKVVDVSIVPYIRSRPIDFAASNLKPITRLLASFDNVDVTSYCTPAITVTLAPAANVPQNATSLKTSSGSKTARILLARNNVVHVVMDDGSLVFNTSDSVQWVVGTTQNGTPYAVQSVVVNTTLTTNATGDVAGVFLIPNNSSIKFTTGEKMFRLADVLGKKPTTAAEIKYVAQGMSQSLERTIVSTRVASASVSPTLSVLERGSSTSTSTVTATTQSQVEIASIPEPLRIMCSGDERTGDFSNGEPGKYEYLISYDHTFTAMSSGTSGLSTITIPTQDAANVVVGLKVSTETGVRIGTGATVTSVDKATGVVTLSVPNTGTGSFSDVEVTFTNENEWVGIKILPTEQPVRYTMYFEGREYTTGFLGSSIFNDRLNSLGLPNVVSQTPGSPVTKLFFKRSSPLSKQARLVVDVPLAGTEWQFNVPSPLASDPSVSPPAPVYSIIADKSTVNEGGVVTFDIVTANVESGTVFTWSLTSGSTATGADFVDGLTTGSVTVNNNRAQIVREIKNDLATDGADTFGLDLLLSAVVVSRSQTVTIVDTSLTVPTYFIMSDKTSVNEGSAVAFNVTTTSVADGTVLYWTTTGTAAAADFVDGVTSGSVTISGNTAVIQRLLVNDLTTENTENFTLQLRTTSVTGTVVATSNLVLINDTSRAPTYAITTSSNYVNEGGTVTYNVTTTGVNNGTVLYWTTSGTVAAADFVGGLTSGTVTINNNTGSFSVALVDDLTTEGSETLGMSLRVGSSSGTVMATAPTVVVLDTSTNVSTYAVTASATTVNEGSTVSFYVNTSNVANGTTLWWDVVGLEIADFTPAATSFTVTNNAATITLTIAADATTEGNQTFVVNVRTSSGGTIVATSESVTVVDTSLTTTYSVSTLTRNVNEGDVITYNVMTSGVSDGTTLHWTVAGVSAADLSPASTSGSFAVTGGTGTISFGIAADATTEGVETMTLSVRTVSISGTIVATAPSVTINDTSGTATYNVVANKTTVIEGGSVTFTVNTTNVSNGTTLWWDITGLEVADFTPAATSFTVSGNTATIVINITADSLVETNQTFAMNIRTSNGGTIVATSGNVVVLEPVYAITASKTFIAEGESVVYNITTQNVVDGTTLYWTATGISAADLTPAALSGSVTVNSNTASFTLSTVADLTTEGTETINVSLRTVSTSGTVVATAPSVPIQDSSFATPTYVVRTVVSSVQEGGTVPFTIATTNVAAGTTLYWTVDGLESADFTPNPSGSFTITGDTNAGVATVTLTITADALTEGNQSFTLQIRTVSVSGTVVATSQSVTVVDTSITRTFSAVPNKSTISEGESVTYTVTTTGVDNGTVLTWWANGINAADITAGSLTGTFTVNNNVGTFTITTVEDLSINEGSEQLVIRILSGGNVVATAPTVTILDTSNAVQTFSISPSVTTVNDGAAVTFTVRTTNLGISNTVTLQYDIVDMGTGITVGDFTGLTSLTDNNVTITNPPSGVGLGQFTLTIAPYVAGEQVEKFEVVLKQASVQKARSSTVSIVNVFKPPAVTGSMILDTINSHVGTYDVNVTNTNPINTVTDSFTIPFTWYLWGSNIPYPAGTVLYTPSVGSVYINSRPTVGVTMTLDDLSPISFNTTKRTGTITVPANWVISNTEILFGNIRLTYLSGDTGNVLTTSQRTTGATVIVYLRPAVGVVSGPYDPVAQTFFVDATKYPNGIFVKSVDLFFAKKSASVPVSVQIRPTVNGYPSSDTILPFATASKLPGQVNVPTVGAPNTPVATNFEFENLVCLAPGQYALVVVANTDEYEAYTATLGEFTLQNSTVRVDKQPTLGSLFKSQNASTWTAIQDEDLMFTLNKCVFSTTSSADVILNTKLPTNHGTVPFDVFYSSGEMVDFAATEIATYYSVAGSGWTPYQLGTNVPMSSSAALAASSDVRLKSTLSTSDRNITPVIDLNRLSNVLVHNIINNDATGETTPETAAEGQAVAKYVTRRVKLAPGFDASDLKVFLFANLPSATSIKVYYKVSISTDTFFDDNEYIEMEVENSGAYSENNFVEYKYKTPFTINDSTTALSTGDRFDTFAVKIVMLSSDSTKVPLIRDLRVIALDD